MNAANCFHSFGGIQCCPLGAVLRCVARSALRRFCRWSRETAIGRTESVSPSSHRHRRYKKRARTWRAKTSAGEIVSAGWIAAFRFRYRCRGACDSGPDVTALHADLLPTTSSPLGPVALHTDAHDARRGKKHGLDSGLAETASSTRRDLRPARRTPANWEWETAVQHSWSCAAPGCRECRPARVSSDPGGLVDAKGQPPRRSRSCWAFRGFPGVGDPTSSSAQATRREGPLVTARPPPRVSSNFGAC